MLGGEGVSNRPAIAARHRIFMNDPFPPTSAVAAVSREHARVRLGGAGDELPKARTGIAGLDEITLGGLPRGRPTLVCGSAGCGKTLLGMEFLIRGATEFDEPGVCITF